MSVQKKSLVSSKPATKTAKAGKKIGESKTLDAKALDRRRLLDNRRVLKNPYLTFKAGK